MQRRSSGLRWGRRFLPGDWRGADPPSANLERFALSRIFPGGADYAGTPEVRAPTAQARHPASAPGFDLRHFDTAWKGGGRTVERPLNKDGKQPEPKCAIANSAHSLQIKIGFPHFRNLSKTLYKLGKLRSDAGGGTRTGLAIFTTPELPVRHQRRATHNYRTPIESGILACLSSIQLNSEKTSNDPSTIRQNSFHWHFHWHWKTTVGGSQNGFSV